MWVGIQQTSVPWEEGMEPVCIQITADIDGIGSCNIAQS